jgi:hypothetical protein
MPGYGPRHPPKDVSVLSILLLFVNKSLIHGNVAEVCARSLVTLFVEFVGAALAAKIYVL